MGRWILVGRIVCRMTFFMALYMEDSLTNSLFLSKLIDDPGMPTVGLILWQEAFVLCERRNSSSVCEFGFFDFIRALSGVMAVNSLTCSCALVANNMTAMSALISESSVPLVCSSHKVSCLSKIPNRVYKLY